jgi:hypothetical protein
MNRSLVELNRENVIKKMKDVIEVLGYKDPVIETSQFKKDLKKLLEKFIKIIDREGIQKWVK